MARGGSKFLTAVISFLLGFLFAIIVEVAAVVGVFSFIVNKDLDTVLSTFGLQNVDEEGNRKYINTDPDNGGVTNLKELFSGVKGLVYENGQLSLLGKSFDDIEQLIPATNMLLSMVYSKLDGYIELDRDEFESTPMSGLAQVLSDSLMNMRTAAVLEKLNMTEFTGDDANKIVKSLLMGAETEYATIDYGSQPVALDDEPDADTPDGDNPADTPDDGESQPGETVSQFKLPVLYDYYFVDDNGNYQLEFPVNGTCNLPINLRDRAEELLCSTSKKYKDSEFNYSMRVLYYVPCRVTENGIEEATYITKVLEEERDGKNYRFTVLEYGEDTDFIAVKPNDGKFVLNYNAIMAAENPAHMNASDRFTGYSYYEDYARNYYYIEKNDKDVYQVKTVSGKNYFRDNNNVMVQLDPLILNDVVTDPFAPLDSVLVTEVVGQKNETAEKVFGTTTLGALMRGEVDFDELVEDLEVSVFVDNVSPDNKVMAYIVFKLSDLKRVDDNTYTAVYDKFGEGQKNVTVRVEQFVIEEVIDEDGNPVEGVKVNDVAALANTMTINLLIDVRADDAITAYLGYGLTGVSEATPEEEGQPVVDELGNVYTYTGKAKVGEEEKDCYILTVPDEEDPAKQYITAVWYIENDERVEVGGTLVNKVSDRVNNFTKDLTIGDVLNLKDTTNQILLSIKDTKICDLDKRIEDLRVTDIFTEEEIQNNAILRQLRNSKVSNLATEIDELLIQRIYSEEVYQLPKSAHYADEELQIMEVIDFTAGSYYLTLDEKTDVQGTKYSFSNQVQLQQDAYEAAVESGNKIYYTYGSETAADAPIKIGGYYPQLLYFTKDEEGKYSLVTDMAEGLEGTEYDDALGHLTKEQFDAYIVAGTKLYSFGTPKKMWKVVLYKDGKEKAYTINNFNNMVNVCASNVNNSTLSELLEAGIIKVQNPADLDKMLTDKSGAQHKLGDLKLSELINIVIGLAQ